MILVDELYVVSAEVDFAEETSEVEEVDDKYTLVLLEEAPVKDDNEESVDLDKVDETEVLPELDVTEPELKEELVEESVVDEEVEPAL